VHLVEGFSKLYDEKLQALREMQGVLARVCIAGLQQQTLETVRE